MDERYEQEPIRKIWGNEHKLSLWQKTELAVIQALVLLGIAPEKVFQRIKNIWTKKRIDINWWKAKDAVVKHDLNAFIDERVRHLPDSLHTFVHRKITSFDTIEAAFATMIIESLAEVDRCYDELDATLVNLAKKYRYQIMNARTHGQEAELQTFGARILTWRKQFESARRTLEAVRIVLMYSKISGAHGKYGTIDPELERTALEILGFKPFYGATQIMPRILYAPIAQALSGIVQVLNNIATDIRLGARSGRPIMREPFSKKQKGSSAMPQKRNPILTEQVGGLDRMARHYAGMITENVHTWEERAIEQSCVERVAWPDLFHVVIRALKVMNTVLSGLRVYPDNMLREIHESRGTYAASEVKEFLKEKLGEVGLGHEDGYRITQLACFNVFEATEVWKTIHEMVPKSLEQSRSLLAQVKVSPVAEVVSIQDFIPAAALRMTDELDITEEQIARYNSCLIKLFSDAEVMKSWNQLFDPAFLLKNEEVLYREILGD